MCFLVDRKNLGTQTIKEFQQFQPHGETRTFDKLYNIAFPQKNRFDPINRVVVTTIPPLYSVLTGQPELAEEDEERSVFEGGGQRIQEAARPDHVQPGAPARVLRRHHRGRVPPLHLHRLAHVLKYFDAFLIGLTATPSKQTIGFFNQNLVMEYTHEQAVADRVNVPYDVYEIRTRITAQGSNIDAGYFVGNAAARRGRSANRNSTRTSTTGRRTRPRRRGGRPDPHRHPDLSRPPVRGHLPGRNEVPKTIIFAKDDSHADDIVRIVREEFGRATTSARRSPTAPA
ncbi:MAG: DEAD/DEAH box helicase family protein [Phycisphaerales bacterium]|nr:DEAD/DEAH box helicase family protein [Phycisphaerales bacterium]